MVFTMCHVCLSGELLWLDDLLHARYFGTQSLIPFGFNIAEPHLVARPLKGKKKKEK